MSFVVLDTDVASRILERTLPPSLTRPAHRALALRDIRDRRGVAEMDGPALLGAQRRAGLAHRLDGVPRVGYDDEVSLVWGTLSAEAVRRGRPRAANDMWNAACCLVEGLPLAALNVKDYIDFVDHHDLNLITAH